MNVNVEKLGPCKMLVRVEVDTQTVDSTFDEVTKDFQRQAALPGFRAGKAPRTMVVNAYGSQIEQEVKRKLISENYRKAITDQKLHVIVQPDIEEIQFGRGQTMQFAATVETAPEFELPEYKGLPVKRETAVVTDADMERAFSTLREQRAQYKDVVRPVQSGDFVVVNYHGTSEGKPLTEIAPTARGLTEQKNFWMHVQPGQFIPGFTEQLVGASAGEKRTVNVDFPADFVSQPLAGKKGVYEVELVQVKERNLPELDDALAKEFGAENLEKLREGVRTDLQNELNYKQSRDVRNQLIQALLDKVTCDLPETIVNAETKSIVYDIVRENQQRGVTKEVIEEQKDGIFNAANRSAKDRVKASFILNRIAEKESVKVGQEDIAQRIHMMAQQYQMPVQKLVKELQERNGIAEINEQILSAKVLDLLQLHAKIEEVPAAEKTA